MTHDSLEYYAMYRGRFDVAGDCKENYNRRMWGSHVTHTAVLRPYGQAAVTAVRRSIGRILLTSGRILVEAGSQLVGRDRPITRLNCAAAAAAAGRGYDINE